MERQSGHRFRSWLQRQVDKYLAKLRAKRSKGAKFDEEAQKQQDQSFVESLMDGSKLPRLAASSLKWSEVRRIFDLRNDTRGIFDIPENELIPVPDQLKSELADVHDFLGEDPPNEAACRMRLDVILRDCVRNERQWIAEHRHRNRQENQIAITPESHLDAVVQHKGRDHLLDGMADYAVWYDDKAMGTSLVVVEAKSLDSFGEGLSQCLAYLGMVHEIRKRNFKKNAIVYGVVSDGYSFTFLRIDNDRRWSKWTAPDFWCERTASRIYTLMRLIIRNAASTSPRTSPTRVRRDEGSPVASDPIKHYINLAAPREDLAEREWTLTELDYQWGLCRGRRQKHAILQVLLSCSYSHP